MVIHLGNPGSMDDLLVEFLTETNESLEVIDVELVTLEKNPDSPEILSGIFRLVHTIKGTCGFLGLPRLEAVAHAAENVLGNIRDGKITVSSEVITLVLEALDRIKQILGELAASGTEPEGEDRELIARLDNIFGGDDSSPSQPADIETAPILSEPVADVDAASQPELSPTKPNEADLDRDRDLKPGEVPLDELERIFQETPGPVAAVPAGNTPCSASPPRVDTPVPVPAPPPQAMQVGNESESSQEVEKSSADSSSPKAKESGGQSIRVSVDLLENLMNMVSELVLSRNQLLQLVRNDSDSDFAVPLQALSHVTTELQESVMQTRMQPIGSAWNKLPRIIRDLSNELGKKIDLDMRGADTELDRQVLELIRDPLTHMVRNSADHGLEMPDVRVAAGKSEIGKVVLNAFHEGGHIIIEIKDDGAGINVDRVKEKALSNGLTTAEELETMPEQKALRFIFAPGFSTAAQVTSVSGRGVGMDVVRTNIEKIGGTVDVKSVAGQGSTFTIKIPLTLAIVSALVIECSKERFAIPQIAVLELVRASDDSDHRIETINQTPVLRLRERLLPLVYLRDILKLNDDVPSATETIEVISETAEIDAPDAETGDGMEAPAKSSPAGSELAAANQVRERSENEAVIIVTQVGNYRFGIVVDSVYDSEEIVVKPVAPILSHINEFSGNTILGDGSVIMILDPIGIAESTGELSVPEAEDAAEDVPTTRRWGQETETLLVFHAGDEDPKAVPLSLVARLEEIDIATIERSNGRYVVQYRGNLMPLVEFDGSFQLRDQGRQAVVVFADGERAMGLFVDRIVDIVEEHLDIKLTSANQGLIGTAVIANKATGIVDAAHFLTKASGDWFKASGQLPFGEEHYANRVLFVDDSRFFRNVLTPVLSTAGYEVTIAENAEEALRFCELGDDFDVIVSDIEMPGTNGFQFAETLRKESRWKDTPMIALSAHATQQDHKRGEAAGFNDYVAKNDRDGLLNALTRVLTKNDRKAA